MFMQCCKNDQILEKNASDFSIQKYSLDHEINFKLVKNISFSYGEYKVVKNTGMK